MKAYTTFTISDYPSELHDIIIAKLSLCPFEAFEEREDRIIAYIADEDIPENFEAELKEIIGQSTIIKEKVPQVNWNAKWEADFKPVYIDRFCQVRASFHEPADNIDYDIVINPKMAFGTAHHETTYMMMKTMETIPFAGKKVFDYGCGTGILAILAHKMGAAVVDAIDYDKEAADNTIENTRLNDVSLHRVEQSELKGWSGNGYDVILANINRHVLLSQGDRLRSLMSLGGVLLLSGILKTDKTLVLNYYLARDFKINSEMERGEWVCLRLEAC